MVLSFAEFSRKDTKAYSKRKVVEIILIVDELPEEHSPLEVGGLRGTLRAAWLLYLDLQIEPGPRRNTQLSYNGQP